MRPEALFYVSLSILNVWLLRSLLAPRMLLYSVCCRMLLGSVCRKPSLTDCNW